MIKKINSDSKHQYRKFIDTQGVSITLYININLPAFLA